MAVVTAAVTAAAAAGAAMSADSRNDAINAANARAAQGEFMGGRAGGEGGSARVGFNPDGSVNVSTGLGAFGDIFQQLMSGSGDFFSGTAGGADQFQSMLQALGQGSIGDIRDSEGVVDRSLSGTEDFNILGEQARSDLAFANQDPFALGSSISDKFRPGLERAQGTLRNNTFDQLFSSGRAANSAAASPVLEGLQKQFSEQNVALDQFGFDQANQLRNDAFGRAFGAIGQRDAIGARNFGESFQTSQLLGQNAMQRFGIGQNMFGSFLANQAQQQQLGLGQLGAAQGISQMPLQFLQAILSAGGLKSDSILGGAGIMASNANNVSSVFGDALSAGAGALGGLMGGV